MPEVLLPNRVSLHAIDAWTRSNSFFASPLNQEFVIRPKTGIVHLRPFALAQLAAWATRVRKSGGSVRYDGPPLAGVQYASRMGLFNFLDGDPPREVNEHEEAGRFIPLTKVRDSEEMDAFLTHLNPLLHLGQEPQRAIQYCLSEMVRNVLEHSSSDDGAFACAQYFEESNKVSIGVADCGQGIRNHIRRNYAVSSDQDAILTALRPGTSGARRGESGIGGENAGAGLFFTKTICRIGGQEFALISGDSYYKLNRRNDPQMISADPLVDNHKIGTGIPPWQGTVVGLEVSTLSKTPFNQILNIIRGVFGSAARKTRRDFSERVRFA